MPHTSSVVFIISLILALCAHAVLSSPAVLSSVPAYWTRSSDTDNSSMNGTTITVPAGTTKHGDDVLCAPSRWTDIITFFVANYLTHVATIHRKPGEKSAQRVLTALYALLFPTSGLQRGVDGILRLSLFAKDELSQAARAGALCMVARTEAWEPSNSEEVRGLIKRVHTGNERL